MFDNSVFFVLQERAVLNFSEKSEMDVAVKVESSLEKFNFSEIDLFLIEVQTEVACFSCLGSAGTLGSLTGTFGTAGSFGSSNCGSVRLGG